MDVLPSMSRGGVGRGLGGEGRSECGGRGRWGAPRGGKGGRPRMVGWRDDKGGEGEPAEEDE